MNWQQFETKWGMPGDTVPLQVPSELDGFLEVFKTQNPKRIVEIGSMHGGTAWFWLKHSEPDARVIVVDLDTGLLSNSVRSFGDKLTAIIGGSQWPSTLNQVAMALGGSPIDMLFIDADHTGDNPIRDFETYSPLLRTGALVGFHDADCAALPDVGECWKKLREQYHTNRTFSVGKPESMGIGALWFYPPP